jgi:hypothetical protein
MCGDQFGSEFEGLDRQMFEGIVDGLKSWSRPAV